MDENTKRLILIPFVAITTFFALAYMAYITAFVLRGPVQVFLGFVFVALVAVTAVFNLTGCIYFHDSAGAVAPKAGKLKRFPEVAVAITSFNEEPEMIRATIRSLKGIEYPKNRISYWLVDDSTNENDVKKLEAICRAEGVEFLHRNERKDFKAGALNAFVRKTRAEFFAVFDADETLTNPRIFLDNLAFFDEDDKLFAVQTVKKSRSAGLFADAIDETYAFFSKFIQPVRSRDGMAMFQGSCGLLRTGFVRKLGGFPPSVTEDTALSFKADLEGYRAIFVPKVYALGRPIESFSAFAIQQNRYGYGNAALVPDFLKNLRKFSGNKKMHYFAQVFGLHYLSMVYIVFAFLTVLFALMGISDVILAGKEFWKFAVRLSFLDLLPFFVTIANMLIIAYFFFGSVKKGLVAYLLNFSVALVRARAALNALFSRKKAFHVVVKKGRLPTESVRRALKTTTRETMFALALLLFAFSSFSHADVVGGLWLTYYSGLFFSAFVFAYFEG